MGRHALAGYTADEHGQFGWATPADEEIHAYVNRLAAPDRRDLELDYNAPQAGQVSQKLDWTIRSLA